MKACGFVDIAADRIVDPALTWREKSAQCSGKKAVSRQIIDTTTFIVRFSGLYCED